MFPRALRYRQLFQRLLASFVQILWLLPDRCKFFRAVWSFFLVYLEDTRVMKALRGGLSGAICKKIRTSQRFGPERVVPM